LSCIFTRSIGWSSRRCRTPWTVMTPDVVGGQFYRNGAEDASPVMGMRGRRVGTPIDERLSASRESDRVGADRVEDIWGQRTPYDAGEVCPDRVDTHPWLGSNRPTWICSASRRRGSHR